MNSEKIIRYCDTNSKNCQVYYQQVPFDDEEFNDSEFFL
jgi:hypothetical protein